MGTPIPSRTNEARGTGSGPVKEYKLSPEELERYRQKATNAQIQAEREALAMTTQPDKAEVLRRIAAGKAISKVEREMGLNTGSLHYWIGKWDLKGIKPDRAQQLLDEMALDGSGPQPGEPSDRPGQLETVGETPIDINKMLRERDSALADVRVTHERAQRLDQHNKELLAEVEQLKAQYAEVSELAKHVAAAKQADIDRLLDENISLRDQISHLETEHVVDEEASKQSSGDPVNHPDHYTAGNVECIDAIEAATTGLTGMEAYCTGAAIKYLWRWKRKNGTEDLQKARWYINRLLGEASEK